MGKLEFVLYEFFRSLKNNLIKDILFMLMITTGVIMTVIMSSYYFDLNENSYTPQNMDGGTWYGAGIDMEGFDENLLSVKGCVDIFEYYKKIMYYDKHPMCFTDTQQSMFADLKQLPCFNDSSVYEKFLTVDHPSVFSASVMNEIKTLVDLKSIHLDYNAYRIFGLQTIEGEGITEENTLIDNAHADIPVVLGNGYKDMLNIGDRFDLSVLDYVYPCKVAGILEKGALCPEDGNTKAGMIDLDTYIIFPYGIRFRDVTGNVDDIQKYAFWDVLSIVNGSHVLVQDKGDLSKLINGYVNIANEFDLPPLRISGISLGLNLLYNESAESIRIILMITIVLLCFTLYALLVAICDKVQSNSKTYGIYLMNGSSVFMILVSYVLEIIVIALPSVLISKYVFSYYNLGAYVESTTNIIRAVYCFVGAIVLIAVIFTAYMIRKIDTEYLIKQED